MSDTKLGRPFSNETAPRAGRVQGSRNKLNAQFLDDLREAWEEHGKAALRICALEQPAQLVKVVASLIPKEIEVTASPLTELSDAQLETLTEIIRQSLGSARGIGNREKTQIN